MKLSDVEKKLAHEIGFDESVCELVKQITGEQLQHFLATTGDQEYEESNGLSIAVQRENIGEIITKLQPELLPHGYRAFWSEFHHPETDKETDEIAIIQTTDSYDIIRLKMSDAANYDLFTDAIIAKLQNWEALCEFVVYGAAADWIALDLGTIPENICSFAEDVYEFCPDSVEQGIGLMEETDNPDFFAAARKLCPELSPQMQEKLTMEQNQLATMNIPEDLRKLLDSDSEHSTSTAMGIKLLAYKIQQSKALYLWWD
jgi:Domain of unknown function (DUF4253)